MKKISRENAVPAGVDSFKGCSWNSKVFSCWKPRLLVLWGGIGDDVHQDNCETFQSSQPTLDEDRMIQYIDC